jgi:hypothetical protein
MKNNIDDQTLKGCLQTRLSEADFGLDAIEDKIMHEITQQSARERTVARRKRKLFNVIIASYSSVTIVMFMLMLWSEPVLSYLSGWQITGYTLPDPEPVVKNFYLILIAAYALSLLSLTVYFIKNRKLPLIQRGKELH